jgi:hypothetical protein
MGGSSLVGRIAGVRPVWMDPISLPTCAPTNVLRLALTSGLLGLAAQWCLTLLFSSRIMHRLNLRAVVKSEDSTQIVPDAATTKAEAFQQAGYMAHSLIALLLMGTVSFMGVVGWWFRNHGTNMGHLSHSTPWTRLVAPNDSCRWMAAVLLGFLTLWDIPTSLYISALRKPDVLIHHGVMAVTAATAAWIIPMSYVYFYFGIVELSSLPLIVYDQLCQWTAGTKTDDSHTERAAEPTVGRLIQWRDRTQILTAVTFTWIRAILFPLVTFGQFLPDVAKVLAFPALAAPATTLIPSAITLRALRYTKWACIGFTILQLYWFAANLVFPLARGDTSRNSDLVA